MAKFQKGNKKAKGGKREGAGRPTKVQQEAKKLAGELVRDFLETNLGEVLQTYLDNAKGHWEARYTEGKNAKEYKVWVVDAPTTRHWIDKLLPAAKSEIGLTGNIGITIKSDDE